MLLRGLPPLLCIIVLAQAACRSDIVTTPVAPLRLAGPLTGGITGDLYVSNRPGPTYRGSKITCATWITVYGAGTNKLVHKLPGLCKGRDGNAALAFDKQGNAYWADFFNGAVLVFAPKKSKPSYTIAWGAGNAYSVAVDQAGRLYVANLGPGVVGSGESSVSVYAAGKDRPSYSITEGITYPTYIVESGSSKLYVANCPFCTGQYYGYSATANVAVYETGKKKPSQVISEGIVQPTAMAVDSSNNLYVANSCGYPDCENGTVSVYKAGADSPYLTLGQVGVPDAVVVDSAGTVYVGSGNNITEFAAGESTPKVTIPVPSRCKLSALALDAAGNLYALLQACKIYSHGAVLVFTAGETTVAYTITKGIDDPKNSFAIAP